MSSWESNRERLDIALSLIGSLPSRVHYYRVIITESFVIRARARFRSCDSSNLFSRTDLREKEPKRSGKRKFDARNPPHLSLISFPSAHISPSRVVSSLFPAAERRKTGYSYTRAESPLSPPTHSATPSACRYATREFTRDFSIEKKKTRITSLFFPRKRCDVTRRRASALNSINGLHTGARARAD